MYLGERRIRSAGRTSGSIEITLPAELHALEGVECRLTVRDGARPEVVLQPDLGAAQGLFMEWWRNLRQGFEEVDEIGDFAAADFTLTLFAPQHWQERPPLVYADALALLAQRERGGSADPEALTRILASLAVVAGYRLGLDGALAQAFGDAVAYLVTGAAAGLGTDFERGMAHEAFWGGGQGRAGALALHNENAWRQARSGFRRIFERFCAWQKDAFSYAAAREHWYRALTAEMSVWATPIEWAASR